LNNEYKPEITVLDRGQQGSTEPMEQWRQARNDSLRSQDSKKAPNSLNNGDKPDENLTDNTDKDRLAQTDSHRQIFLIEFKY